MAPASTASGTSPLTRWSSAPVPGCGCRTVSSRTCSATIASPTVARTTSTLAARSKAATRWNGCSNRERAAAVKGGSWEAAGAPSDCHATTTAAGCGGQASRRRRTRTAPVGRPRGAGPAVDTARADQEDPRMRVSVELLPDASAEEVLAAIDAADDSAIDTVFCVDEVYHRDAWMLLAAAARRTRRVRLGPGVAHTTLRDPLIAAQQL